MTQPFDNQGLNSAIDESNNNDAGSKKSSKFTPTCKGILIGAVAGSILPVFGTISGAIIGGIAGKVYEKKCMNKY